MLWRIMASLDTGSLHDVMQASVLISSQSDATAALTGIDDALTQLTNSRSTWGAHQIVCSMLQTMP